MIIEHKIALLDYIHHIIFIFKSCVLNELNDLNMNIS